MRARISSGSKNFVSETRLATEEAQREAAAADVGGLGGVDVRNRARLAGGDRAHGAASADYYDAVPDQSAHLLMHLLLLLVAYTLRFPSLESFV